MVEVSGAAPASLSCKERMRPGARPHFNFGSQRGYRAPVSWLRTRRPTIERVGCITSGAVAGNRTRVASLEDWSLTIRPLLLESGATGRSCTPDRRFTKALLCCLSYGSPNHGGLSCKPPGLLARANPRRAASTRASYPPVWNWSAPKDFHPHLPAYKASALVELEAHQLVQGEGVEPPMAHKGYLIYSQAQSPLCEPCMNLEPRERIELSSCPYQGHVLPLNDPDSNWRSQRVMLPPFIP